VRWRGAVDATEKAVLDAFKALVSRRLRLHQMMLFGSRARGDAEPDSDMDVLVILEGSSGSKARDYVSDCAWEAGFERGIVVVPVVFSREQWERGPERHSLLAEAVRAEGVPL
jgi:predicted nucleotidyltransferase